jgi:SAM-dependent methyltransferase
MHRWLHKLAYGVRRAMHPVDRVANLLQFVDVDREIGLEIGPLDKPLVQRVPGRSIYYCDYAPREVLRTKSSADPNVRIDNIPEIDFVTTQIRAEVFGGKTFDYVLASHVIEHVPDMLGWLGQLLLVLNPGGRIVLAVPDRRYTFDYLRPLSTLGQLLEARHEQRTRPVFSQVYDAFGMAAKVDTALCWSQPGYPDALERYYTKDLALRLAEDARDGGGYHDCHCWVFTYESFLDIVAEAQAMGALGARIEASSAPVYGSNEFHVVLGRA